MEFWSNVLRILDARMEEPTMFGWFHLLFIFLTAVAAIVFIKMNKNGEERFTRRLLIISSVIVLVLELYKQINYSFSYDNNIITFDYQWYAFPFQFCSTPMYVGLLAGIIKNKRIHEALTAYLGTFAVFAGICTMAYPPQMFITTIGINIQTMVCHGLMISTGVYLLATNYVKKEHKTILKAIPVFAACILLAIVMNEIANASGLLEREDFNMFYISPHQEPSLPVYSIVQQYVPYPWCLIIYIAAFSLASYLMLLLAMLISKISKKTKKASA